MKENNFLITILLILLYAPYSLSHTLMSAENSIAQASTELAQALQGDERTGNIKRLLVSKLATHASDELNNSLQPFGIVQTQLSIDNHLSLKGSFLDALFPFYDSPKNLLFTQWGVRKSDQRIMTNVGMGYRYFTEHGWMFGYNTFYDIDWHNNNRRYGIGLETWSDYLKIAVNGYRRLSGWRHSPNLTDYDERPSNGWDLHFEGWLPSFPQLGGKLIYEKHYGNNVALFSENSLQKNPYAITTGFTYTPFPLLTAGIDYRRGQGSIDDVRFNFNLTHRFGESLKQQLTYENSRLNRSLISNRFDLVNRNNTVVLDYRKQTIITLQFPPALQGEELTTITLIPHIKAKYKPSRISLDDTELRQAGGKIISNTPQQITLQLPAWSENKKIIPLSGRAWDTHGNSSEIAHTQIIVNRSITQQLSLNTDKTTATADGKDIISYTLTVTDVDGNPISGQAVSWQYSSGILQSNTITNEAGIAKASLSSKAPGVIQVSASNGSQSVKALDVTFISSIHGELTADKTQAVANGVDSIKLSLTLKDSDGKLLSGKNVRFSSTLGSLAPPQGVTDQNGQFAVKLISTKAGQAVVKASVDDMTFSASPVTFHSSTDSVVAVNKTTATANGQDSVIFTATVKDSNGSAIAGQAVNWHTNLGNFTKKETITDATGTASAILVSQQAGYAQVSLSFDNQQVKAPRIQFVSELNATLHVNKTSAKADGAEQISYILTLKNTAGQAVPGKNIHWITNLGTLTANQTRTDSKGQASVSLSSLYAGTAVVNVAVDNQQLTAQPVTFTRVIRGNVTTEQTRVHPNSTQTITLMLTDATGSPVVGENVRWHSSSGTLKQSQSITDSSGRSTTVWESNQPGTAIIEAEVDGQHFPSPEIVILPAMIVTNIIGIDARGSDGKNFGSRIPEHTWPGAKFKINTANASGSVTWRASSAAVSIENNIVTVINNPSGVTLTGTDSSGQVIKLTMGNNWFARSALSEAWINIDIPGSAIHICKSLGANVATEEQLQSLMNEWQELHKYPGWTSLSNHWLYSSTTVILHGRKMYRAFFTPSNTISEFPWPDAYFACK